MTASAADLRAFALQVRTLADELLAKLPPEPAANAPDPAPVFLSVGDFAERRAVSASTVKRWIKRGLPVSKMGNIVRVKVAEAERWIDGKP